MREKNCTVRNRSQFSLMLRAYRESHKLTQAEVGTKAHVPQTMVSKIEGETVNPTLTTCFRLLQALGLELVVQPRSKVRRKRAKTSKKPLKHP